VQKSKLWMLQTRNGKRTGFAAVRFAVDMVHEGLISKEEALSVSRIPPDDLNQLLQPLFDPAAKRQAIAGGRLLARVEGIWTAPEAAATLAALLHMKDEGQIEPTTRVVLILTGAGIKYPPPPLPRPVHLEGAPEAMLARVKQAIGA